MLGILAKSFKTATRSDGHDRWTAPGHWTGDARFGTRSGAEIEAHLIARRRV